MSQPNKHPILYMNREARNAELRRLADRSDTLLELAREALRNNVRQQADAFVNLANAYNDFRPVSENFDEIVAALPPQ